MGELLSDGTPMTRDVEGVAKGLTEAQRRALLELPLPRDADRVRWIAARPYSSTWRKASAHLDALYGLHAAGLVEWKLSRGETLWRLTRPSGLALKAHLLAQDKSQ